MPDNQIDTSAPNPEAYTGLSPLRRPETPETGVLDAIVSLQGAGIAASMAAFSTNKPSTGEKPKG